MANTNFKIAAGITLFVIVLLVVIVMRQREGYGVFSHRGALHGIKNQTRNHYSFGELDYQNPSDYWDYGIRKTKAESVYDRDIQSYHAKRFDPKMTM